MLRGWGNLDNLPHAPRSDTLLPPARSKSAPCACKPTRNARRSSDRIYLSCSLHVGVAARVAGVSSLPWGPPKQYGVGRSRYAAARGRADVQLCSRKAHGKLNHRRKQSHNLCLHNATILVGAHSRCPMPTGGWHGGNTEVPCDAALPCGWRRHSGWSAPAAGRSSIAPTRSSKRTAARAGKATLSRVPGASEAHVETEPEVASETSLTLPACFLE